MPSSARRRPPRPARAGRRRRPRARRRPGRASRCSRSRRACARGRPRAGPGGRGRAPRSRRGRARRRRGTRDARSTPPRAPRRSRSGGRAPGGAGAGRRGSRRGAGRAPRARRHAPPPAQAPARAPPGGASGRTELRAHVVDGVAHGPEVLEVLVVDAEAGDLVPQLLLERLHELDERERVGVQVVGEGGGLADRRRVDLEDVGELGPHELEDLAPGHRGRGGRFGHETPPSLVTPAPQAGAGRGDVTGWAAPRSPAPSADQPRSGATAARTLPTRSTLAISAATRAAFTIARAEELPWLMTHRPSTPSRMAPPVSSGSTWLAYGRSAGTRTSPAALASGLEAITAWSRPMKASSAPSSAFRATLPVKPSVTTTSTRPARRSRPSTLPTKRIRGAAARRACASFTSGLPFVGSSPIDSRPTDGSSMPSRMRAKAVAI